MEVKIHTTLLQFEKLVFINLIVGEEADEEEGV